MKFFVCILAVLAVAQAAPGLLPHVDSHHGYHHEELPHLLDAEIHHSDGIHLGHSAALVHDDHHLNHHLDHHLDHHLVESLPTTVYHHEPLHYHYARLHSAPVVHHHHHDTHAAVVHHSTPAHFDVHSHSNLLSFAKHALHGKYGKVRITETHY
uniref:GEO07425p1 n=1 Tax=Drosophila melanogaster TaxID=7227 RepID=Q9VTD2_DROME|eukprot:NP_648422.1 uncharacterized protein Dmel_CG14147 [Drosophila melanogaster]